MAGTRGRRPAAESEARASLLTVARDLFARQGFAATSTRQLAAASGQNICLISYYFGGKAGLYRAVLDGINDKHLAIVERTFGTSVASAAEFAGQVRAYVEAMLGLAVDDPAFFGLSQQVTQETPGPADDGRFDELKVRHLQGIAHALAAARAAGHLDFPEDPLMVATLIVGFVRQQVRSDATKQRLIGLTIRSHAHRQELATMLARTLIHGIGVPSSQTHPLHER